MIEPIRFREGAAEATRRILEPYARGVEIEVLFLEEGLDSVEYLSDDTYTAPLVARKVVEAWRKGFDGAVINCFDDPGLEAARELVPIPVVGACQASLAMASLLGDCIGIVTVGGIESVKAVRRRVELYGFDRKVLEIRTLGVGVLDIERERHTLIERIESVAREMKERGVEVLILGCTGLSILYHELRNRCVLPVIDPTIAGFLMLRTLIEYGARNPIYVPNLANHPLSRT